MHVTGGQYKGHKIIIPNCAKPTLSKVREGVFNVLYSLLDTYENKTFLDLYAGSGIMSLEAISRGFYAISVDNNQKAIKLIKENLKISKEPYKVVLFDSEKFIEKTEITPDVIYLDPPWNYDYKNIIYKVSNKFKNSILIVEYDKKRAKEFAQFYTQKLSPFKEKVYGRSKLDFLKI